MIKSLWASGLLTFDIVRITGATMHYVSKCIDQPLRPMHDGFTDWEPRTLDALIVLVVGYEDDGHISATLVRRIMEWGTPIRSIARLTGIPAPLLREAVVAARPND